MGPSSIEMVIKAPETVIRQFIGVAVVSERSRAQWCPRGLFQIGGVLSGPKGSNKCSWFEGCNYLSGAP